MEIPDREQDSIEISLAKYVHTESYVHTDAHTSYFDISWNGYGHRIHNHKKGDFRGVLHLVKIFGQLLKGKL